MCGLVGASGRDDGRQARVGHEVTRTRGTRSSENQISAAYPVFLLFSQETALMTCMAVQVERSGRGCGALRPQRLQENEALSKDGVARGGSLGKRVGHDVRRSRLPKYSEARLVLLIESL